MTAAWWALVIAPALASTLYVAWEAWHAPVMDEEER